MSEAAAEAARAERPAKSSAFHELEVHSVKHYTDTLFSFRVSRPETFRFRAGEFVMIGLEGEKKPILRAYSVASPTWDEELEFYSIKVPGGALTSRLKSIQPGDTVLMGKKPTGTLVTDALRPGRRLYLLSTGTGVAPFASLIREPEVYEYYDEVVLTHTCRTHAELAYSEELVERTKNDPLVGEEAGKQLVYFNSVTREEGARTGRVTDLIRSGALFEEIGGKPLDPEHDRVMICGSEAMLKELKEMCLERNFIEGSNAKPGDMVIEKAFVGEGV